MTVHDALAAVPTSASGDPVVKDLLHNLLIERYPYVFEDSEDPEAFDAVDGETGAIPVALVFQGGLFTLDVADTTTAHDGVVCLVTNDGKRYKRETVDFDVKSVLDKDVVDPPAPTDDPAVALGDRYIVPAGASGDWGTHPEDIAIYTARGWVYIEAKIGQLLYVEDEESYYHFSAGGSWEPGIGQSALANNSIFYNHVLGDRTHWVVVNQTTNTPPVTPSSGDAYIVGGSPTGAWAGHTGKIAIYSGSAWLIFAPVEGWTAYDQALNATYVYSGAAWVSQRGSIIAAGTTGWITDPTTTTGGTGNYAWSASSPPTTVTAYQRDDGAAITIAVVAGRRIRFKYEWTQTAAATRESAFGLMRGSEAAAIDHSGYITSLTAYYASVSFECTAVDGASHTYRVANFQWGTGASYPFPPKRSRLSYEVFD